MADEIQEDPLTIEQHPTPTGQIIEQSQLSQAPNEAPAPEAAPQEVSAYARGEAAPAPSNPVQEILSNPSAYTPQRIEEPTLTHHKAVDPFIESRILARDQKEAQREQKILQKQEDTRAKGAQAVLKDAGVEMEIDPATGAPRPRTDEQGRVLYKPAVINPFEQDENGNVFSRKRDRFGNEQLVPLHPKTDPETGEKWVTGEDGVSRVSLGPDEDFLAKKNYQIAGQELTAARTDLSEQQKRQKQLQKQIQQTTVQAGMLSSNKDLTDDQRVQLKRLQDQNAKASAELAQITEGLPDLQKRHDEAQKTLDSARGVMINRAKAKYQPLTEQAKQTSPDPVADQIDDAVKAKFTPPPTPGATEQETKTGLFNFAARVHLQTVHGIEKALEGVARLANADVYDEHGYKTGTVLPFMQKAADFLKERTQKQADALKGESKDLGYKLGEQGKVASVATNIVGGIGAMSPGIVTGGVAGLLTLGGQAMAEGSANAYDEAKAKGLSDDKATAAAYSAALKTVPSTALFALTGAATSKTLTKILPLEASPITRAAAALVVGSGANMAATAGGKAIIGESPKLTAEDVVNSIVFAAHGSMTEADRARDLSTARSIIDGTNPDVALMDGIAEGRVPDAPPAMQQRAKEMAEAIRNVAKTFVEKSGYKAPESKISPEANPDQPKQTTGRVVSTTPAENADLSDEELANLAGEQPAQSNEQLALPGPEAERVHSEEEAKGQGDAGTNGPGENEVPSQPSEQAAVEKGDSPEVKQGKLATRAARKYGITYQGVSDGLHAFKDPETGGNFSLKADEITPEGISQALNKLRESFAANKAGEVGSNSDAEVAKAIEEQKAAEAAAPKEAVDEDHIAPATEMAQAEGKLTLPMVQRRFRLNPRKATALIEELKSRGVLDEKGEVQRTPSTSGQEKSVRTIETTPEEKPEKPAPTPEGKAAEQPTQGSENPAVGDRVTIPSLSGDGSFEAEVTGVTNGVVSYRTDDGRTGTRQISSIQPKESTRTKSEEAAPAAPSAEESKKGSSPSADVQEQPAQESRKSPSAADSEKRTSTQLNIEGGAKEAVLKLGQTIAPEDLYHGEEGSDSYGPEYGLETEPHITALYGLETQEPADVRKLLENFGPVTAKLGKVSLFENENRPYDVVKIDVEGPDIHRLNAELKKLPYKSDFPDYHPHVTLAYVKKGTGKKYVGAKSVLTGKTITFDTLKFSDAERNKTDLPLGEKPASETKTQEATRRVREAMIKGRVNQFLRSLKVQVEPTDSPRSFRANWKATGRGNPAYSFQINYARIGEKIAGMSDAQAREWIESAIGEEVDHFAQFEAVRRDWEKRNRKDQHDKPQSFGEALEAEYSAVEQAMTDEQRQAAKDAYEGDSGVELQGSELGAEFVRQMLQHGAGQKITEAAIRAKPIIERILGVLKDLLSKLADAPAALRNSYERAKAVLEELSQSSPEKQPKPADRPESTGEPPAGPRRVRLGNSPQSYEVIEELPRQKGDLPEEKYFRVRNEKTGAVQTVEQRDMKPIGAQPTTENASSIESAKPLGEQPSGTPSTGGPGSEGVERGDQGQETPGKSPERLQPEKAPKVSGASEETKQKARDAFKGLFAPEPPSDSDYHDLEHTTKMSVLNGLARKYGVSQETIDKGWNEYGQYWLRERIREKMDANKAITAEPTKPAAPQEYATLADAMLQAQIEDKVTPAVPTTIRVENRMRAEADKLEAKTGFPDVPIADVLENSGFSIDPKSMAKAKGALVALHAQGKIQFGGYDWSLSSDREKAWAIRLRKGREIYLTVKFEKGLSSAEPTTEPLEQKPLPKDRRAALFDLADSLEKDGIDTPEKVATFLDEISPQLRPYAQSLWDTMGAAGSVPRGTHDWPTIFASLDEPVKQPEPITDENSGPISERDGSTERQDAEDAGGQLQPSDAGDRGRMGSEQPEETPGTGEERASVPAGEGRGEEGNTGPTEGGGDARELAASRSVGDRADVRRRKSPARVESNYVITPSDDIGGGGMAQKFADNISAISLLKEIESENRPATDEEKAQLVKYVGWGGMKNAFNPENADWKKKAEALKSILTPEEYETARRTIQDAHYTSPDVINGIYKALARFGFNGGKMVEGGSGVGHFIGLLPAGMRDRTSYLGVEQDSVTARISKLLYPKAQIIEGGFQNANLERDHFDASAGNPPFGQKQLFDPNFKDASNFSIHNYFIAKQIELLRPSGVGAWVVSHYFLDAQNPAARNWIADRANFLGAIRLPNTAFKKNANTDVTTDIVFFQKLMPGEKPSSLDWTEVEKMQIGDTRGAISRYFVDHPEMMLGTPTMEGTMYPGREEFTLSPKTETPLADQISQAVEKLPEGVYDKITNQETDRLTAPEEGVLVPENVKVGSYFIDEKGQIHRRTADLNEQRQSTPVEFQNETQPKRVSGMIGIRDALNELIRAEISDAPAGAMTKLRKKLGAAYDQFVEKFGPLNTLTNRRAFNADTDAFKVLALERDFDPGIGREAAKKRGIEPRKPSAKKAAIFEKRVNAGYKEVTKVSGAKDALTVSLNQRGTVDLPYMQKLSGMSREAILKELGDQVFQDPQGDWQQAEKYLSGNVREKLRAAEAAAKKNPEFERNVEALKNVIPADIAPQDIRAPLGSPWIKPEYFAQFAKQLVGETPEIIAYAPAVARWNVRMPDMSVAAHSEYGVESSQKHRGISFGGILDALMNNKPVQVMGYGSKDVPPKVDQEGTAAAQQKADLIKQKWADWVMQDPARREDLTRVYNDTMNVFADTKPNGLHLTLPGKTPLIELYPHQLNAAWRIITDRTALLDQVVGAGKTFIMATALMEMKRLGFARKQLLVVPNHLTTQWRDAIVTLYPNANVLYATPKDFEKKNRQQLFARMVTGEYDAIIIGHSSLKKIGMPKQAEQQLLREMLNEIAGAVEDMRRAERSEAGRGTDSRFITSLEKMKDSVQAKLDRAMDNTGEKDTAATFDELGIDGLYLDEAHEFKNLFYTTGMQRVAGLGDPKGSAKAFDLFVKTRWMQQRYGGKAPLVFATGTPISNSLVEMFTMQRYLQGDKLKAMGLNTLDSWAKVFGDVKSVYEVDPSGTGYRMATRFANFQNVGELGAMYRSVADVVTLDDLKRQTAERGKIFPVPKVKGGKPNNYVVDRSDAQALYFGIETPVLDEKGNERLDADGNPMVTYTKGSILDRIQNLDPARPDIDNMLVITNDARKSSLDMRLVDPNAADFPGSKPNTAVAEIVRVYQKWNEKKGTQLVFCDLSVPASARGKATEKAKEQANKPEKPETTDDSEEFAEEEKEQAISMDEILADSSDHSVYDDMKAKLIAAGIPEDEIAFIHDYDNPDKKQKLFDAMNEGKVRILFGSTPKLGAGTNVQRRLVALHHLDAPWRPSDLEQREGRIIRQGNLFFEESIKGYKTREEYEADPEAFEVEIHRYATRQTYDTRMWQLIEHKAAGIGQFRQADRTTRDLEDVSGEAANASEMKAAASGDPLIQQEIELRSKVKKLDLLRRAWESAKYQHESEVRRLEKIPAEYDQQIQSWEQWKEYAAANPKPEDFSKEDREKLMNDFVEASKRATNGAETFATYRGVKLSVARNKFTARIYGKAGKLDRQLTEFYENDQVTITGLKQRIDNALDDKPAEEIERLEAGKKRSASRLPIERELAAKPFESQAELDSARSEHSATLAQLRTNRRKKESDQIPVVAPDEPTSSGGLESPEPRGATPNPTPEQEAKGRAMREAFNKLSDIEKKVLTMRRRGSTNDQIKEATGFSDFQIEKAYRSAMAKLQAAAAAAPKPVDPPPARPIPQPSATQQRLGIPVPTLNQVRKTFTPGLGIANDIKKGIQSLLLPTAVSPEHLAAAELVGRRLGEMHRRAEVDMHANRDDRKLFERLGVANERLPLEQNPGVKFMSDMSQGRDVTGAGSVADRMKIKALAERIREQQQQRLDLLEEAGAELEDAREHYFKGMWTYDSRNAFGIAMGEAFRDGRLGDNFDVNTASAEQKKMIADRVRDILRNGQPPDAKDMLQYLTRRPLKGKESFRRRKVFDDIMTGVEFGLQPVSNNPVVIHTVALAEIDRSIMANQVFRDLEKKGDLINVNNEGVPMKEAARKNFDRSEWTKIDDKYGTIWNRDENTGALIKRGERWAKKPVAAILNNYLSSSLYNNPYFGKLYTAWMGMANLLNQSQLGVGSAFHAGFTAMESQISAGANILNDIYGVANGTRSVSNLIETAKRFPVAIVENPMTGDKVLNAWRNPEGTIDPRIAQVARAWELSGGGFTMEKGLQTNQLDKLYSDWYSDHRVRAALRSPFALIELMAKPIMEYLVPRQKAGVFAHLAWRVIEQNPGKPLESLTHEFREIAMRVDARLGQVRYDRLFINNTAKNVIQALVRAPGWTGGTIAEIGGAFKDTAGFFKEWSKTGRAPKDLPKRLTYTLSLLLGVATLNALLTYLFTGEGPSGLADIFSFRTGGKDENGNPDRYTLPTYMKDVWAYMQHPGETILHKSHPLLNYFSELFKNKDYYGVQVRDEDASIVAQAGQVGAHAVKTFVPFWIRGYQKADERGESLPAKVAPLVGVMPAPKDMNQSPAYRLAAEIVRSRMPSAPITEQQQAARIDRSQAVAGLRRGDYGPMTKAIEKGTIKPSDVNKITEKASLPPLAAIVKSLPLDQAERVWKKASDEEKREIAPVMEKKRENAMKKQMAN